MPSLVYSGVYIYILPHGVRGLYHDPEISSNNDKIYIYIELLNDKRKQKKKKKHARDKRRYRSNEEAQIP